MSDAVRPRIHEPAVTLTDVALAVETGLFAWRLWRRRPHAGADPRARSLSRGFVAFFATSAAAALAGAAVHGRWESKDDPGRLVLWRASLCSVGLASWTLWHLAAAIAWRDADSRTVPLPVHAIHLAYLVVVVSTRPPFRLALAMYTPGVLVLSLALLSHLRVTHERGPTIFALLGLTISTAAGIAQLQKVALHPRFFDHNATFHVFQTVAFACIYRAASKMSGTAQACQ